jgi:hypothetical protein
MSARIKTLIEKNKEAYKKGFYIESMTLSYTLVLKALKQICSEEELKLSAGRTKLNDYVKCLSEHLKSNPEFKGRLKNSTIKTVAKFNADFKSINKELKYQYPEVKIAHAAKQGMQAIVLLNTSLIKLKNSQN